MDEVTRLVDRTDGANPATDQLMAQVYDELRRLAAVVRRREPRDLTLKTTDLVHEVYLRLSDQERATWKTRAQFFGLAAEMMRRILVDHARSKLSAKRGAGIRPLVLDEALSLTTDRAPELVALDEALESLATLAPQQARIVEMRFFAGLSAREISSVLGISTASVNRQWRAARAWLYRCLEGDEVDA